MTATAIAVSVLSGLLALVFAVRVAVGRGVADRVANGLHLAMALAMLAMPWAWAPPPGLVLVFFTAAAAWFAYLAVFLPTSAAGLAADPAGSGAHVHHGHPVVLAYHAAMMLAMAWMGVAMLPQEGAEGESSMQGMQMGDAATSTGQTAAGTTGQLPWAAGISIALGVGFAVAAVWFVVLLVQRAASPRPDALRVTDTAAAAGMAAVMSGSLLVLMT